MINEIKKFNSNALALEIIAPFTEADALLVEKLFEEKLANGAKQVNILVKVKDLSVIKGMNLKGFFQGELWAIKHFSKMGRCAVVSHSSILKSIVTMENKILHLFNPSLQEKYFDEEDLNSALDYVSLAE